MQLGRRIQPELNTVNTIAVRTPTVAMRRARASPAFSAARCSSRAPTARRRPRGCRRTRRRCTSSRGGGSGRRPCGSAGAFGRSGCCLGPAALCCLGVAHTSRCAGKLPAAECSASATHNPAPAACGPRARRFVGDGSLWAVLAAMAMAAGELPAAEAAFAAIGAADKLAFVQRCAALGPERRAAELALYRRQPKEAEALLLQVWLLCAERTVCYAGRLLPRRSHCTH